VDYPNGCQFSNGRGPPRNVGFSSRLTSTGDGLPARCLALGEIYARKNCALNFPCIALCEHNAPARVEERVSASTTNATARAGNHGGLALARFRGAAHMRITRVVLIRRPGV
jgi:hypothetical protein